MLFSGFPFIYPEYSMESSRILVTGFPEGTTESDLVIYFQSTRDSGGGDVKYITIDHGQTEAVITFEKAEAATRVVRRKKHRFKNCLLKVALLAEIESSSDDEGGIFQDHVCCPEETQNTSYNASQQLENRQTGYKRRTIAEGLVLKPPEVTTNQKKRRSTSPQSSQCTVKVTGVKAGSSEDLLKNYFENNRRSQGGPVSSVVMRPDLEMCLVTFESPDDARRITDRSSHNVAGLTLHVSLHEELIPEDDVMDVDDEQLTNMDEEWTDSKGITIVVSGMPPATPEDAVRNYFENSRRSGGGEVCDINFTHTGDAVISFTEVEDLKKLLQSSHSIGGKDITVVWKQPKKEIPQDPLRVHVAGLSDKTTEDCLLFYLEKFSFSFEVKEVTFLENNDAIATFSTRPDFKSLFNRVHSDPNGLDGSRLHLKRVPICSCILVTGLKENTSNESIKLYFENTRRSGGNLVKRVDRKTKETAITCFEDPASVQSVIQRMNHTLENNRLGVKAHYPFLKNNVTNKTEITIDADIFDHIELNYGQELQALKEGCKIKICRDCVKQIVTLSPSDKGTISQHLWKERAERLQDFLQSFQKIEISIAHELFDEISDSWRKQSSNSEVNGDQVYFLPQGRLAQIIGKSDTVSQIKRKLEKLILASEEDINLMKSMTQEVEDGIPRSKLRLLQLSGICERLQRMYSHLSISFDLDNETMYLDGPGKIIEKVKAEVFKFIFKMSEKSVELPVNLINVLKKPHVSSLIQDFLNQREIQAIFVYDQSKSLNEIQVLGIDAKSTKDAEKVLLDAVLERNISLTQENTEVLDSRCWKDFCTELTTKYRAGIIVDIPSNTVWVRGLTEDVNKCFDKILEFLQRNTILHESIQLDPGSVRFIFERCTKKLEAIKRDLNTYSVDIRMAPNFQGIEVAGTAEGLEESLSRLVSLIDSIRRASVPIDKPGMKKLFTDSKGPRCLKPIENDNNCTIIVSERKENEALTSAAAVEAREDDLEDSHAVLICSYLTGQGKKISVFKGDITKHRVDAIVNAANEDLKHVGGLAASIIKVGGQEIQECCNAFVQENGPLFEGRTFVTPAGTLPCDRIIHTVGPKWDPRAETVRRSGVETHQERVLKFAIRNCLKEATRWSSIAIPAVSSGVFGFPRELCAKVIVDTVLDFCKANPSCKLSDIHLLNNDIVTVKVFAEEIRRRFAGENQFEDNENPSPAEAGFQVTSGGQTSNDTPRLLSTPEGLRITMKVADLAQEKADVLVGTAAQSLILNQNPCAKALSDAAGHGLQRECYIKSPVTVGDIAVLRQTGRLSCKAVYFAVCSDWDNGKGGKILKGLLEKCLKEANRSNMTSIAFAAIGTGNVLRFPRDRVANMYFEEVIAYSQKNPATNVKDVRFVLCYDTQTIKAFDDEFKKRFNSSLSPSGISGPRSKATAASSSSVSFSPVIERTPDNLEITVGSISFKVQVGDITNDSTEAIAVITNNKLDLSVSSGAGAAILKVGGDDISSECSRYPQQNPGSVVATTAGRLRARLLFHIVPLEPFNSKTMKTSLHQCLQEAEKKQITSISFPAIGTGVLSMSAKSCAQTILSALRDFANQRPAHVQLVKMAIFKKEMIKDVRGAMYEASGRKPPAEPGLVQRLATGMRTMAGFIGLCDAVKHTTPSIQPEDHRKFDITIFAGCERDLREAITAVNEVMVENFTNKLIKNEAIRNLTDNHISKLDTLKQLYGVKVTVEKEVDRIEVSGQAEDILSAMDVIHEMLNQIKTNESERIQAEAVAKDIRWLYKIGSQFEEYESDQNAKIELAYSQRKNTKTITQDGEKFIINFDEMTEMDERGQKTEIKRLDYRRGIQPPDYWDLQPQDHNGREREVHSVQLNPSTQEYKRVSDLVKQGCPNIVRIERIQNPALFGMYAIQKQKMDAASSYGSNEMWLFHGTSGANCDSINHGGFDRSYSWQKNTLYGKGVYFARDAIYSARCTYSPVSPSTGLRHMYLARVLVGEYTVGKPDIAVAPKKNSATDPTEYDSVVDQIPQPTIFVVFRDYRSYPEYLISFK